MCGEFDDHERVGEELFDRFLDLVSRYGVSPDAEGDARPAKSNGEAVRSAALPNGIKSRLPVGQSSFRRAEISAQFRARTFCESGRLGYGKGSCTELR